MSSHPRTEAQVLVVGSVNVDLTVRTQRIPGPGETVTGTGPKINPGGKGANQAVAAAKLGATVAMAGAVGRDVYADVATQELRAAGVDLTHLLVTEGPCGMAFITVDDHGENVIVVTPGANAHMSADRIDTLRPALEQADVVVLQGEIPPTAIEKAIGLTCGRVLLNLAPAIDLAFPSLLAADPLVVNETEGRIVLARFGQGAASDQDDEAVVADLVGHGIRSLIMTRGSRGAIVADASGTTPVASPSVDVVDTTGAGDAFVGALASALANGDTLLEAAKLAVRVGAYACTGHGAQPSYPTSTDRLPGEGTHG